MDKAEGKFLEDVGKEVVDIAFHLHKTLGPGLLESVYEKCFCYELRQRGLNYISQMKVPIVYDGLIIEEGLRLDLLVEIV